MKRYDADDPQAVDELVKTRAYGLLKAFLERSVTNARTQLEQSLSAEETATLRGKIQALKEALDLPNLVKRDIKEAAKLGQVATGE